MFWGYVMCVPSMTITLHTGVSDLATQAITQ